MIVEFCPAPMILTESFMYRAPLFPEKSFRTLGRVSVKVPAASWMVSVPATAFALSTASRKLQDEETSALLVLLHALAIGDVGAGSSLRLTKNVGSGSGIDNEGAISPWWTATTPGRPSMLIRTGKAVTGEPE